MSTSAQFPTDLTGSGLLAPSSRSGLWDALARTMDDTQELPVVRVEELGRSMFDYDPALAVPLD